MEKNYCYERRKKILHAQLMRFLGVYWLGEVTGLPWLQGSRWWKERSWVASCFHLSASSHRADSSEDHYRDQVKMLIIFSMQYKGHEVKHLLSALTSLLCRCQSPDLKRAETK